MNVVSFTRIDGLPVFIGALPAKRAVDTNVIMVTRNDHCLVFTRVMMMMVVVVVVRTTIDTDMVMVSRNNYFPVPIVVMVMVG